MREAPAAACEGFYILEMRSMRIILLAPRSGHMRELVELSGVPG